MAYHNEAPYRPQDPHEVSEMIRGLTEHIKGNGGQGGFSCKKATFNVTSSNIKVDSWKMQDWDYKKPNLPTYARGLFTTTNSKGHPEIVTRGYDKFFNHGEVNKTEWSNVERNTRGPYELSVKENGCIIFLSGLEDGSLLVCSKHSTGPRADTEVSHAVAGEKWVERHLASVGKSKKDLAAKLRAMNATAVAELCDDEFEEHVLAYDPETAGLYLHGINLNLPEFATYPHHLVDKFASEWGFKHTMFIIEDDINKVKSFLDRVAETGSYQGRDTEGFVVRCQARETPDTPWEDWFFKYKFDEPYLMYRQWRECTKALIAERKPKFKKHKNITEEYLHYAQKRLKADPKLGKEYNQNHGIIKLREDFLTERGLKGSDIIRQEMEGGETHGMSIDRDVVLVPIATIGCGKTTVALALCKLFAWGHIQNDNITQKPKGQKFAQAICDGLVDHPVMIADRNNHQRRERKQIFDDVTKAVPHAHFVALQYVHERAKYSQIEKATRERVLSRGDNHQTIQAGSKGQGEIISIMNGFMQRFEPVNHEREPDNTFEHVINLDPTASSRDNLETVVSQLNAEFPKLFDAMPSGEDLDAAIQAALNDYTVDIKHEIGGSNKHNKKTLQRGPNGGNPQPLTPKFPKLEYFGATLDAKRVRSILDATFRDAGIDTAKTYRVLETQQRIQTEFHVTLIHRASANQHKTYWDQLSETHASAASKPDASSEPALGSCKMLLERLVWDDRLMCFVVRIMSDEKDQSGMQWRSTNETAHVTVGTVSSDIKPKESNDLLKRWLQYGSGGSTGISEMTIKGHVELPATVKGVLQKH
jgi:tRNA ligase